LVRSSEVEKICKSCLIRNISSCVEEYLLTWEQKFHISNLPCNVLFMTYKVPSRSQSFHFGYKRHHLLCNQSNDLFVCASRCENISFSNKSSPGILLVFILIIKKNIWFIATVPNFKRVHTIRANIYRNGRK